MIAIPKSSPAARNRYIYYPDHLVKMPVPPGRSSWSEVFESWGNIFRESLYRGLLSGLAKEATIPLRKENIKDESLGDFLSRRFGSGVADNLVSAVCHGIYAGDIYKMSARTLQPTLWHLETRDRDRPVGILPKLFSNMLNRIKLKPASYLGYRSRYGLELVSEIFDDRVLPSKVFNHGVFKDVSVLTFRHGLAQLTAGLKQYLARHENITMKPSTIVGEVTMDKVRRQLAIKARPATSSTDQVTYADYVVSTLGPRPLQGYLSANSKRSSKPVNQRAEAACERSGASVTVMVVNLYYADPKLIPDSIRGFGYLIPRSVPLEQNPERALGVIFSSETSGLCDPLDLNSVPPMYANITWRTNEHGQKLRQLEWPEHDRQTPRFVAQDTAPGTKLTVMMGGHWWSGWPDSDIPSEDQAVEMAQSLLKRHLQINEKPVVAKARLNKDCIPQYPVGYSEDMATIHEALIDAYQGRFKVVGPWWQGAPGMNDCILSAHATAWKIRDRLDQSTGLEWFMNEKWHVTSGATGETGVETTS